MRQLMHVGCSVFFTLQLVVAAEAGPSPQVERGREIFLNSKKGTPCGRCHSLAGVGKAIGPNLGTLASTVGPRGLVMTFKMTVYAYVKDYALATETFSGIERKKEGNEIEIYDLSQPTPVLRKVDAKRIISAKQTRLWKHPPAGAGYTSQELADLIGFLKWAANGSVAEIKASEVEPAP